MSKIFFKCHIYCNCKLLLLKLRLTFEYVLILSTSLRNLSQYLIHWHKELNVIIKVTLSCDVLLIFLSSFVLMTFYLLLCTFFSYDDFWHFDRTSPCSYTIKCMFFMYSSLDCCNLHCNDSPFYLCA